MPTKIEKDRAREKPTTGHEWDGIREYDLPLPKWWLYILYATIAWAAVYFILYPAIPGISGFTRGVLGWDSRSEVAAEIAAAKRAQGKFLERIRATPADEIRRQPDLFEFAMAGGRSAFAENCVPCHAAGGAGRLGYPSLADDVWIWGGSVKDIETSIRFGIRSGHDQARNSAMPSFGEGTLKPAEIADVAEFVLAFTGRSQDKAAAERGAKLYETHCVSCHGETGAGNVERGGPPLATRVWLYGGTKADIVRQMTKPQMGVMPAWAGRLDDETIKMLVVYVHALGGGK